MDHDQLVITIKNVGKRYDITHQRGKYITLRDVIANIFRSPFAFLKMRVKQATGRTLKEEFWALKDINFNVKKGEVIGIIGPNGSGKSTLLKILSQITPPTTGEIVIRGKVGSLLEVGTGFHPELSGRENIFLNGAILGMERKEVASKFDKIVEFAGVEQFIDTPVKYYSSGMYVRLAFSVAAHMEPDILIIDEVLAVGDAEFQKKCLGKMDEITKEKGRTIIFVSHNMSAIEQLCSSVILLKKGKIVDAGPTKRIIDEYLHQLSLSYQSITELPIKKDAVMSFSKISIMNGAGETTHHLEQDSDVYINLHLEVFKETKNVDLSVGIKDTRGTMVIFSSLSDTDYQTKTFSPGKYVYKIKFKGGVLMPDTYSIRVSIHHPFMEDIDTREDVAGFTILPVSGVRALNYGYGSVTFPNSWSKEIVRE